jgi:CRISPR-associated protein Cmr6
MADACRSVVSSWWELDKFGENAGLLRDRFLRVAVKDKKNHPPARSDLFEAMCQSLVESNEVYSAAYQKQESAFKNNKSKGLFSTDGRMVIGLGGENVLETGLTLNHTYGTPMIPGTALKGLAAHYCHQAWGAADERFKAGGEYHQTIFGTTEDSGHIIFHDAWVTPESLVGSLQPDVMTPHHGDYYSDAKGLTPPTDFDDPNPVTFLSVVGTFNVAVSCDVPGPDGDEWAERVFGLLSDALREWGIGGKTNAGYGHFSKVVMERKGAPEKKDDSQALEKEDSYKEKKEDPISPALIKKTLKYRRGDTVEVTKVPDPNERRGASYFRADDGIGGLIVLGTPPSVEIGQKTRLEIDGVMEREGLYNFAVIGAKREPSRKPRDRRGRR